MEKNFLNYLHKWYFKIIQVYERLSWSVTAGCIALKVDEGQRFLAYYLSFSTGAVTLQDTVPVTCCSSMHSKTGSECPFWPPLSQNLNKDSSEHRTTLVTTMSCTITYPWTHISCSWRQTVVPLQFRCSNIIWVTILSNHPKTFRTRSSHENEEISYENSIWKFEIFRPHHEKLGPKAKNRASWTIMMLPNWIWSI